MSRDGTGPSVTSEPLRRRVAVERLTVLCRGALRGLGMPEDDAELTTDVLVDSSLRGIDSHGVEKIAMYADRLGQGGLVPDPAWRVEDGGTAAAVIDAGRGLGFAPSVRASDLAVEKAGQHGVGAVAVRDSGHFGAGGYYVRRIAERGLVGFISTNARRLMPSPGGTEALVGNNPFAFGAPRAGTVPYVFDMACSVGAFGKVRRAAAAGDPVPSDWGYDSAGRPTTDPDVLLESGLLAPVGGYKGFHIAVMMEILSAALCGAAVGPAAGSIGEPGGEGCGHFVLALDPVRFGSSDIGQVVEGWFDWMRRSTPEIRIPGESGEDVRRERLAVGVPVLVDVLELCEELGDRSPTTTQETR